MHNEISRCGYDERCVCGGMDNEIRERRDGYDDKRRGEDACE